MPTDTKVAGGYVDLELRLKDWKQSVDAATAETRKLNAEVRSNMKEANGSIALLGEQIGVHLPRHLRTFVAGLPGVSTAMSAAFNAVAVFALINIVVEAGKKLYEFAEKSEEAGRKHAEAWKSVNAPLQQSNDELQVTNDKLAASIAKLSGKPHNGIKEAIDEAVVSADKLSTKLDADLTKIQEALKNNSVGFTKTLFGQASTSDIEEKYQSLQGRISEANTAGNVKIRAARDSGDPAQVDAAKKALDATLSALYQEGIKFSTDVLDSVNRARAEQARGGARGYNSQNMDARSNSASGLLNFFGGQQDALNLTATNDALTKSNDALTAQKENTDAAKKASADRLRAFETAYEQQNALNKMSLSQEASYWNSKLSSFKAGSQEYLSVLTKFTAASEAEGKYLAGTLKDYRGRTGPVPSLMPDKNTDGDSAAIAKGLEQQASLKASITEATTKFQLNTGAISEHDAAIVMAGVHTDEYRAKVATLTAELAKLRSEEIDINGKNVDPDNATKQQNVQNQIDELNGKARIQSLTDAQSVLSTTWKGMIDSVFDSLVAKSKDTTSQIKTIASSMIDGLNSEIAKAMTGQKTNFKKVFEGTGEQLAKTGLQKAEGIGLSALGFGGGKRDGSSAATALYVQMATPGSGIPGLSSVPGISSLFGNSSPNVSGPGGAASSATHGLLGFLNDNDWASSLMGGKLFGAGSMFGGGFALGGDVTAGVEYTVGELGPEKFQSTVPGRIIPHNQLGNGGPSIGYIDARGTDPVQTQMAVARGMAATHSQSVRDAAHVMTEHSRRTPK